MPNIRLPADLTGQRFGKIVVETANIAQHYKYRTWLNLCKCGCGITSYVTTGSLRHGHTKSCGCLVLEVLTSKEAKQRQKKWDDWCKRQSMIKNSRKINFRYVPGSIWRQPVVR